MVLIPFLLSFNIIRHGHWIYYYMILATENDNRSLDFFIINSRQTKSTDSLSTWINAKAENETPMECVSCFWIYFQVYQIAHIHKQMAGNVSQSLSYLLSIYSIYNLENYSHPRICMKTFKYPNSTIL